MRRERDVEVVGLATTFNTAANRVAMHGVRRALVRAQSLAAGLSLLEVELPWPCSNEVYERQIAEVIAGARKGGVTHFAFGDLFLEEIRAYRCRQLAGTGIEPLFPLWGAPHNTADLARQMIAGGLRALITCVDPKQADARLAGREFDTALLDELPASVDPCGERGEFHTFCYAGPMFSSALAVVVGERVERDGFCFADVLEAEA